MKAWFTDNVEAMRDAMAQGRPSRGHIPKTKLAYRDDVKKMLVTAGVGLAACRLPPTEQVVWAANSYMTLLQRVRPMYEDCGSKTNYLPLEEALYMLKQLPYVANVQPSKLVRGEKVSAYVTTRELALRHLKEVLDANKQLVAHAFGFYCAMSDQTQVLGGTTTVNALQTSFSLTKLRSHSHVYYTLGFKFYSDYARKKILNASINVLIIYNLIRI